MGDDEGEADDDTGDDDTGDDDTGDDDTVPPDADGDGYPADDDCDDTDAAVHPGAEEVCNGIDDDCDPATDENIDDDGDGFSECDGDCDDDQPLAYPGAEEVCGDGIDNDCDGTPNDCGLYGTIPLSQAPVKIVGEQDYDVLGFDIASAGDTNGDGFGDIVTGVQHGPEGNYQGAAGLFLGPLEGVIPFSEASATLIGESAGDCAGYTVSGAGDVNADGLDDVLVGASKRDEGGEDAGAVYLVLSPVAGEFDLAGADAKLLGYADEWGWLGQVLAPAGDTDGDGFDDFLIGHDWMDEVFLVRGPISGTMPVQDAADVVFYGGADGGYTGYSVASAGDVNADGYLDLLIGSWGPAWAFLVYGPFDGEYNLSTDAVEFWGENTVGGRSVTYAGNIDGDGFDDLLIAGAWGDDPPGPPGAGVTYLIRGGASTDSLALGFSDARIFGEHALDHSYALGGAGDVDGDGFPDILIGSGREDTGGEGAGAAYLIYGIPQGTTDLSTADAKLIGEAPEDSAGYSVAGAGDVNADGYNDVLIGAYGNDQGGEEAGAVYLLYGGGI